MTLEKVQPAPRKDSVRNGVVVGAVVGGVAAFAWMGVMYRLCESFDETGGGCKPSFPRAALPVTIFGAGAGGLIGFLIDSLR